MIHTDSFCWCEHQVRFASTRDIPWQCHRENKRPKWQKNWESSGKVECEKVDAKIRGKATLVKPKVWIRSTFWWSDTLFSYYLKSQCIIMSYKKFLEFEKVKLTSYKSINKQPTWFMVWKRSKKVDWWAAKMFVIVICRPPSFQRWDPLVWTLSCFRVALIKCHLISVKPE